MGAAAIETAALWAVAVGMLVLIVSLLQLGRHARRSIVRSVVTSDAQGVRWRRADGTTIALGWSSLRAVDVALRPGVAWRDAIEITLTGAAGAAIVTDDVDVVDATLAWVAARPGVDQRRIVEAVLQVDGRVRRVWVADGSDT